MAGDPCQLPPVVAAPAAVTPSAAAVGTAPAAVRPLSTAGGPGAASGLQQLSQQGLACGNAEAAKSPATGVGLQGLARPLLVRLIQMGHKAHLLRTQYRQSRSDTSSAKACSNIGN